ncbi:hypothetical protein KW796_01530 [Candidatus Parcubacteria bacterium]|nr:hypothetical protein [Candidatus Parcubacteria bacterium]
MKTWIKSGLILGVLSVTISLAGSIPLVVDYLSVEQGLGYVDHATFIPQLVVVVARLPLLPVPRPAELWMERAMGGYVFSIFMTLLAGFGWLALSWIVHLIWSRLGDYKYRVRSLLFSRFTLLFAVVPPILFLLAVSITEMAGEFWGGLLAIMLIILTYPAFLLSGVLERIHGPLGIYYPSDINLIHLSALTFLIGGYVIGVFANYIRRNLEE